jgi:N-methylhydantoinase B
MATQAQMRSRASAVPALDAVTAAILRGKLEAAVLDMSATLRNTAPSRRISVLRQFSCAVLDQAGQVIVADNPHHLASLETAAAKCIDEFRFDLAVDDTILTNHPYGGGPSVHYFTAVAPVGTGKDIFGYLVTQAHVPDIGGVVMGNYYPAATEILAEGVHFPPMRVIRYGRERQDVLDTILLNSREAEEFRRNLDAMFAAVSVGRRRLLELVGAYGFRSVGEAMTAAVEYSERMLRRALAKIPTGGFEGEAILDHDGQGRRDVRVRVRLERREDGLTIDFEGSEEVSRGFVNAVAETTRTYAMLALLGLVDGEAPWNSGLLRAVDVKTRPHTVVDPQYPAATGWGIEHVGFEIVEAVRQAVAAAAPDLTGPGYPSRLLAFTVHKEVRVGLTEEQLGVNDLAVLGQPGSSAASGLDGWGQPGPASLGQLPSVEEFERETDLRIARLEYRLDSGGAGRWRGGLGTETVVRFPRDSKERLYACVAGAANPPSGCAGGRAGGPSSLVLEGTGEREETVADLAADVRLDGGMAVRIGGSGGGGFGDPRGRPPEEVRDDVLDGYVSVDAARELYAVALDAAFDLDDARTGELRAEEATHGS